MAKQSLSGLLGTNDATVMALNQQVTGMLATTGIMPPDAITTQMGTVVPGMMGGMGGMGMGMGMGMMGGSVMPGMPMNASTTIPLATPMGMGMGGLGMRNSLMASGMGMPGMMAGSMMGRSLAPGTTIIPQQMMGST